MELATRSLASGSALPNILKVQNRTGNFYRSGYQSSVQLYDCGEFVILASQDGLQQCNPRLMTNYKR